MKVLAVLCLFVLSGICIELQGQTPAKVIAEIAASSDRTIKNAPFSAEAVSESVQVLADGNRIVRSTKSKLYRNSEGRFRREISAGSGGVLGSTFAVGGAITILDPVEEQRYTLNLADKTARVVRLRAGAPIAIAGSIRNLSKEERAAVEAKVAKARALVRDKGGKVEAEDLRAKKLYEINAAARATTVVSGTGGDVYSAGLAPRVGPVTVLGGDLRDSKYETRTEELGTRDIEGVMAEGTRKTTTIPAGAIGNERPIEITYERWYSKDLELVVYSKQSDPRFGDQTYKVTNIIRSEPDPSLFTVPTEYKVLGEPASVYRLRAPRVLTGVPASPKAMTVTAPEKPSNP